jgi:hypothetical protein
MQTDNVGAVVELIRRGPSLKIRMLGNGTGLFSPATLKRLAKGQYIGVGECLVLTMLEDPLLSGLLAFQADCPWSPRAHHLHWCGGVSCHEFYGDLYYQIHPLFLRDVNAILGDQQRLWVAAVLSCVKGIVTERPYWLMEIPCLTRAVLLHLDQIIVVRRRKLWKPGDGKLRSLRTRGEYWQTGALQPEDAQGGQKDDDSAPADDPSE